MSATATGTLFARDTGGAGRPLVLLHGFGGFSSAWNAVIARLPPGRRVIAYDLPGHGASLDVPGAGRAKAMASAVLADLAARDVPSADLAGHSMGGAVATLAGILDPGRVASLTLVAPGGFGEAIAGSTLRRYAAARSRKEIGDALALMWAPGAAVPGHVVDTHLAMRERTGQVERLEEIVGLICRGETQGMIPTKMLAGLAMPVTVLWGDADPVLPFAQARLLPATFRLVALPGLGHMLPEEAPDAIAAVPGAT